MKNLTTQRGNPICQIADVVCIEKDTTCIALNAKDIPDLVQFLAWAMRTRFAEPEYNTQEE